MGPGPIPVSAIRRHARNELDLSQDAVDRFVSLIRQMDDEYLVASAPKTKGKNEPDPDTQIPADDVEGVRAMFKKRIAAAKKPGKQGKEG